MVETLVYIHPTRLKEFGLEEFFERIFVGIQNELISLRRTIYNYEEHHYIFALNERAWIGVFNNAIIRTFHNSSDTLQEFSVYNRKRKFIGRADFLVRWEDEMVKKEYYMIFEAKQYEEKNLSNMLDDSGAYLNSIKKQGQRYYNAESTYYNNKKVFIIPIVFGWIRKPGYLDKAKEYFDNENRKDTSSDFCFLYFEGNVGAWIFGKIFRI